MININQNDYEKLSLEKIEGFLDPNIKTPIFICGTAASLHGWREVPYLSVPCSSPKLGDTVDVDCKDPGLSGKILLG